MATVLPLICTLLITHRHTITCRSTTSRKGGRSYLYQESHATDCLRGECTRWRTLSSTSRRSIVDGVKAKNHTRALWLSIYPSIHPPAPMLQERGKHTYREREGDTEEGIVNNSGLHRRGRPSGATNKVLTARYGNDWLDGPGPTFAIPSINNSWCGKVRKNGWRIHQSGPGFRCVDYLHHIDS